MRNLTEYEISIVNGGKGEKAAEAAIRKAAQRAGPYATLVAAIEVAGDFAGKVGFWLGSGEWPSEEPKSTK